MAKEIERAEEEFKRIVSESADPRNVTGLHGYYIKIHKTDYAFLTKYVRKAIRLEKSGLEKAVKKAADELSSYAMDIRMDWSGFDGRDLLRFTDQMLEPVYEALTSFQEVGK